GQLLFLLHMRAHVRQRDEGGSRVAIIMNGSPLFTGDAGSGESEIRRWILEHDLLEALIALPEQLFYNTGIATYVWVLTNRKRPARRGRVQLVDATAFWTLLRKSLGAKRREVPFERKQDILQLLADFEDGATRRICRDRGGRPEPDPELRDTENVPLGDDVESFFAREVKPHVPDAWIDTERRDPQDGKVGLVGYEINFNRYFY
ncbi:MAG: N-6 DNA methylase, partial [Acidobacteria bacterium]|nr:N-6 DNA methylase [Acidobacteriota bacterium]